MTTAEIHGKLSPHEESLEDLLTSEIFDALDLLGYSSLRPWLAQAKTLGGPKKGQPLGDLLPVVSKSPRIKIIFWPWLGECIPGVPGCEPDILLIVDKLLIVIEMKYWSGKSGEGLEEADGPTGKPKKVLVDQLGREWMAGFFLENGVLKHPEIPPIDDWAVVFVTQDHFLPVESIKRSIEATEELLGEGRERGLFEDSKKLPAETISWVNYEVLYTALLTSIKSMAGIEEKVAQRLLELLRYKDFEPFLGVKGISSELVSKFHAFKFIGSDKISWPSVDRTTLSSFDFVDQEE